MSTNQDALELRSFLYNIGLEDDYFRVLSQTGVGSLSALADLNSDDFQRLRFSSDARGRIISGIQSLSYSLFQDPIEDDNPYPGASPGASSNKADTSGGDGKRKYVRRPKKDPNAPPRPKSAYVEFSTKVRRELGTSVSFAEASKIAGERWSQLGPQKDILEKEAATRLAHYHIAFREYQDTPEYSQYQGYLRQFREEQTSRSSEPSNPNDPSNFPRSTNPSRSSYDLYDGSGDPFSLAPTRDAYDSFHISGRTVERNSSNDGYPPAYPSPHNLQGSFEQNRRADQSAQAESSVRGSRSSNPNRSNELAHQKIYYRD